jgi:hypothetical protein
VLFKYKTSKYKILQKSIIESGIPQKIRVTNRHKNVFYPIALMMVFTFIPLLLLIPLAVVRDRGLANNNHLIIALFILATSFLGNWIFRFSGGFSDIK